MVQQKGNQEKASVVSRLTFSSISTENDSHVSEESELSQEETYTQYIEGPSWPIFIKTSFLTLATFCIEELSIMEKMYTSLVGSYSEPNMDYKTLEERFEEVQENYEEMRLNLEYNDMHKLQKEVSLLIDLLRALIEEVRARNTFFNVRSYMQNLGYMLQDENKLFDDVKIKQKTLTKLRKLRQKQKGVSSMDLFRETVKIAQQQYHDEEASRKAEVYLVKRWEAARREQNSLKLEKSEQGYSMTTEIMLKQIDLEDRCHDELMTFLIESQEDYFADIQNWMDQYDRDTEGKDFDIFNMHMRIEKMIDKREEARVKYEERTTQIEEWLEYKRKKKEEEQRRALENMAATIIQTWWRLVMQRRKLGPYGRTKKGKKKGKTAGKKNKRKAQ